MQVGRWGNSLAVRLPAAVVEALGLKEGDEIEIEVAGARRFALRREDRREAALESLRRLGWHLPPGYRFDRADANERGQD